MFSLSSFANLIQFDSHQPIRAIDLNNNFNYVKEELENKYTNVLFSNYISGQVIDKDIIENDFQQLRNLGINVENISKEVISAEDLNNIFNQIIQGISVYNDAPIAYNSSITVNEDTSLINAVVFSNAVGTSFLTIENNVQNGILNFNSATGSFVYIPNLNYNGQDSFSFKVSDGEKQSEIKTVNISVLPINDKPTSSNASFNLIEDTFFSSSLIAQDIENDLLSFSLISQATKGFVNLDSNGNFSYISTPNSIGLDSFTFVVSDGINNSETYTVTLNINPVNDQPIAIEQYLSVNEDGALSITLDGADIDLNNLTYGVVQSPINGTLSGTGKNLIYTPNLNFNGQDSFTFKVNDGQLDSEIKTINISVLPVNDQPIAISQSFSVSEYKTFSGTLSGTDIDLNNLTYHVNSQGTKGNLVITNSNTGAFIYTPNNGVSGLDIVSFVVNDGIENSLPVNLTVTINPVDSSCDNIKARGLPSGYYQIDLDSFTSGQEPISLYCEFDVDSGNSWTQVARVNFNDTLWNAWNTDVNLSKTSNTEKFGLRLSRFTNNIKGRDLELMVKVNGQYRNIVYYDVNLNNALNPTFSTGANVVNQEGFFYRSFGESSYTRCGVNIESSNSQWNWSIADTSDSSCAGFTNKGGFLLGSNLGTNTEIANTIYGLNQHNNFSFSNVEIFIRKKTLSYPISCQHGFDNGIVTTSTSYNIDVDSDGNPQSIYCSVSSPIAYTLLINFGANNDYGNLGVLNNGLQTNTQARVTSAGFSTNANNWNNAGYPTNASYLQFFLGGDSTGNISIRGPKWGGTVQSSYRAMNGAGNYVRFRINNSLGNTNYGVIQNTTTTQTVDYSFKDIATFFWEEYPSSVAGMDIIWIR